MARGTQLSVILSMVREEARHSTNVALGRNSRDALINLIVRTQIMLWEENDWEFLKVDRDVPTAAGQRYYSFPADLDYERIIHANFKMGSAWMPLTYGIDTEQFASYDSDIGVTATPLRRWRFHQDGGDQFELWPFPPDATQTVRFRGIKRLAALVADTDRADLDDRLISLWAAAELLAHQKAEDAKAKLAAGQKLLRRLTGRNKKQGMFVMGGGVDPGARTRCVELRTVYTVR